jgi:transcriptional regulator of acetoin/glycerol metabolism
MVGDDVFQSWSRCLRRYGDPRLKIEFQPVSRSRTHLALQRNREFLNAWSAELESLQQVLRSTPCGAVLTDSSGVVIAALPSHRSDDVLMSVAHRVGVNLSEEAVGTTAPGVVAKTGRASCVLGGEHFFETVQVMHCAAAPIRNLAGSIAGVLDLSSETVPFGFDASALVSFYAAALEIKLLYAQAVNHVVVRLHVHPGLLNTPLAGLVAIDSAGRVAWANGAAARWLGGAPTTEGLPRPSTEEVLGLNLPQLVDLSGAPARHQSLPNGLGVWLRAEIRARDGRRGLGATDDGIVTHQPAPIASGPHQLPVSRRPNEDTAVLLSLRASDDDLVTRTLRACGGNISEAARRLKVSRGLIYRRIHS